MSLSSLKQLQKLPPKVIMSILGVSSCLILILAIGVGVHINKTHAESVDTPNAFSTPAVLGEAQQVTTALLTKESGDVEYKLPNENEYKKLEQDEERVPTGTTVKTGNKSLAHIVFPDNSFMSLSQNTEVVINYEEKGIRILQMLGNTWHRVETVLNGHSYAVETPNTLATVRGTEFNVAVLPNKRSEISVTESIVDVSKIEKKDNGEMVVKETQRVEKDKQVVVPETKNESAPPLKVEPIPEEKKQTVWFQRNVEITEEIKQAQAEISITPEAARSEDLQLVPTVSIEALQDAVSPTVSGSTLETPTPTITENEIKQSVIQSTVKSLRKNRKIKQIDSNTVLQKNEEKVMEEFPETVMTAPQTSSGEVQGVTAAPVVEEALTAEPEIGGVGAETLEPTELPTSEPIREVTETPTEAPTQESEQPTSTPEENQPEVQETPAEPTPWYHAPVEMIQNLFESDPQPTEAAQG